jgi:uracil-DNA glycosylase
MSSSGEISIDDIIQFLKQERELYGPYSVQGDTAAEDAAPQPETGSAGELQSPPKERVEEEPQPAPAPSLEERLKDCNNLQELQALCEAAGELKTDLEGTNLVFGVGNHQADLMLIGEAPGEQEDREGEPFVGAAGQLLNKILAAINFERDQIYIANILKHRPPGNRNPKPEECERSLPYLNRQIELIQPKVILCLGKISGSVLLNSTDSLRNMRGGFHKYMEADLTVTYHPAALLRNAKWKRPTWEDVQKVRQRYDELGGKP